MEDKIDYFIERTDKRLEFMENTLKAISDAVVSLHMMQDEVVKLKHKVESLEHWRIWLAGASFSIGGIGGMVVHYIVNK